MSHRRKSTSSATSRRDLLKTMGITASTMTLGASFGDRSARADQSATSLSATGSGRSRNYRLVAGIDPANIVDEYRSRELDTVSDADIYRQVVAIVSQPQAQGINSFALHAPLELMARYGLLSLIEPSERPLARLQMVASASVYESGVETVGPPKRIEPFSNLSEASREFTRTFTTGDPDGMEALVLQIAAQFGSASLIHLLTPLALPTLTGASHSHIGLWLLLRHGRVGEAGDAALLRAAARRIAADPKGQLTSFSGMAITGSKPLDQPAAEIEREIFAKLSDPPRGKPGTASLRPLIEAGEATGNADRLFGDFVKHDLTDEQMDAAFRAVLRVCAHSMLQDDISQAKFGWSHCLTLPQAACGLSSLNMDRKLALAATLVWITAYRSVLSTRRLDFNWVPQKIAEPTSLIDALHTSPAVAAACVWYADASELPLIMRTLATQASIRNDQHLVKYTRACFDMGSFDPVHKLLYLAAAAHLCGLWIRENPTENIRNDLLNGRSTQ
jgi:hypothetical protein